MVHTSASDVIATMAVGTMKNFSAATSSTAACSRTGGDPCRAVVRPHQLGSVVDGGVVGSEPTEIVPGRLYTVDDLHQLLPPTLARTVIARCRMIDGVVIGQAAIDLLTKMFLEEGGVASHLATGDHAKDELMTLEEAAEYLRVSERTMRRMVEAGTITAKNLAAPGSKKALLRFTKDQLHRDMKKAETSSPTPPPSPKFKFSRS